MAGPGNILIKVGADTGKAVSELSKVNSTLGDTMTTSEKMGAGLRKAAAPAAAALGVIAVGAKKAIDSASELNEQINKTNAVFGDSAPQLQDWSKTLVKSFGMSQTAALEAAGTFGNMLVPMGFARKEAAGMSQEMVQLAGDMASFNNASPAETLAALQSGLAGESEPLRKFGVFLDDARLKQEAMQQGLYNGKGALDAHAKAAATMAIIMKDTADTQGDFARTSESAANQQRTQAAMAENLSAQLGQALLPAYIAIQQILLKVIGLFAGHTKAIQITVGAVAALAAGILIANAAMKAYAAAQIVVRAATAAWTAAQWLLNAALSANPIGLVIIAVAALGAALVIAYQKSATFRSIVTAAFNAVQSAAKAIGNAFQALVGVFSGVVSRASAIAGVFGSISSAVYGVISAVQSLISALGRIKVPHINLPGPFMAPLPPVPGAVGVAARAGTTTAAAPGGVTININGSLDPEGTARAIRRLLNAHDRRQGRVYG